MCIRFDDVITHTRTQISMRAASFVWVDAVDLSSVALTLAINNSPWHVLPPRRLGGRLCRLVRGRRGRGDNSQYMELHQATVKPLVRWKNMMCVIHLTILIGSLSHSVVPAIIVGYRSPVPRSQHVMWLPRSKYMVPTMTHKSMVLRQSFIIVVVSTLDTRNHDFAFG